MARTLAQKLLIRVGDRLWMSDPNRLGLVGPLPDDVLPAEAFDEADVALVLVEDEGGVRSFAVGHRAVLGGPRALWLLYSKGNRIGLNRDSLWPIMAEYGVRPITQVAVDEVWSALRFRPFTAEEVASGGRWAATPSKSGE